MKKTPILINDKKFAENFEHCSQLYKSWNIFDVEQQAKLNDVGVHYVDGYVDDEAYDRKKSEKHEEYLNMFCVFMDELANTSRAAAERAVEVLGENPSFEAVESNLMAEINYADISLNDEDYQFLATYVDKFAVGDEKIIAIQRGHSFEYPNLESVKKGLVSRGLTEVQGFQDVASVMYHHIDYEKEMPAETQALVSIIERYLGAVLEKKSAQPGE